MIPRFVDYCSGAFLLTRSELFKSLNGFDTRYIPAYYEETDYCVEIQKRGYKVLYEPRVRIRHFEFGSAGPSSNAMALMNQNRLKFLEKHQAFLNHKKPEGTADIQCRSCSENRRVLYIDDGVPHPNMGAGFPRSCQILNGLAKAGNAVTLFPTIFPEGSWHRIYEDLDRHIEVVKDAGPFGLTEFLTQRRDFYDIIWISRPHNMQFFVNHALKAIDRTKTKIIYDAEALFHSRVREERRVQNKTLSPVDRLFVKEMALAKTANAVVSVSEPEANVLRANGQPNTFVIGHNYSWIPAPKSFEERSGMVILCSLHASNTPNYDALIWFLDYVLPKIKEKSKFDIPIHVAGNAPLIYTPKYRWLQERIHFVGKFADLDLLLSEYRIGILPTRIAAGIPQKAYDLASRGVPAVCTEIIASQMNWKNQIHSLVADWTDPDLFAAQCVSLYTDKTLWTALRKGLESAQKPEKSPLDLERQLRNVLGIGMSDHVENGSGKHG
jgi:hypothetical protein